MFNWDRGVEFESMKARLESRLARAKSGREYAYTAVLLVQLVNGARVSEAVEALQEFAKTGERKVRVRVRKRKGADRLMVIPKAVDLKRVAWLADEDSQLLKKRVCMYALNKLRVNTHSLRYAFITYMSKQGISAQLIAKMTGHASLKHILHYTQKAEAEEILEKLATES